MKKFLFIFIIFVVLLASCATSKSSKIFTLELEGNPTTGYQWVLSNEIDIVKLVSSDYVSSKSENKPKIVGRGGKFIFNFVGLKEGEGELEFVYMRSWEPESPADKKNIKINVDRQKKITFVNE